MIPTEELAAWKAFCANEIEHCKANNFTPPTICETMLTAIDEIERLQVLCREAADRIDGCCLHKDGFTVCGECAALSSRLRSAAPMAATTANPIYQPEVKNGE